VSDRWDHLRRYTPARIALGRAGSAVPTGPLLAFQWAHARARDAVHLPWDVARFARRVQDRDLTPLILSTRVADRVQYLKRPDLGRQLDAESAQSLPGWAGSPIDVALIFTNGLSSTAVEVHGLPLLDALVRALGAAGLRLGPICLAENGRVALADPVGAALGARLSVIVVGERPGLSAADSLGLYLTYAPGTGRTDAERNCISNVRPPEGLAYDAAAAKLVYLAREALRLTASGVALKDDQPGHRLTRGPQGGTTQTIENGNPPD
jgi:ethanolamine ammonia-lyase small subunit